MQIFLNQKGDGIYLFNGDCSIQRRHQKIIKEEITPQFFKKLPDKKLGKLL
ncbi:hypothetical protein [Candidatus Coxiella mudrowiae]|uniref:hypothetical protein n=1 Tax=Candidatus Coxiella mudrowiae TaxID=2054173 RepID=UPI002467F062|nr:hypothetical protein [Candidatus Coxiella mudrowiae]